MSFLPIRIETPKTRFPPDTVTITDLSPAVARYRQSPRPFVLVVGVNQPPIANVECLLAWA
jgi:hypothetical protein